MIPLIWTSLALLGPHYPENEKYFLLKMRHAPLERAICLKINEVFISSVEKSLSYRRGLASPAENINDCNKKLRKVFIFRIVYTHYSDKDRGPVDNQGIPRNLGIDSSNLVVYCCIYKSPTRKFNIEAPPLSLLGLESREYANAKSGFAESGENNNQSVFFPSELTMITLKRKNHSKLYARTVTVRSCFIYEDISADGEVNAHLQYQVEKCLNIN